MIEPLFRHPGYPLFAQSFHERHLEELDFLFDQRAVFFADPLLAWPSVERLDARIQAHAGALAAWGESARSFLPAQLEGADTALPAAFVLASLGPEDAAKVAVSALDTAPPELLPRITLALSLARGPDLGPALGPLATSASAGVRAAVATIMGSRRRGPTSLLERLLHDPDLDVQIAAARAFAGMGAREMVSAVERRAAEAPPDTTGFLLPLVELSSRTVAIACRKALSAGQPPSKEAITALAIVGDATDVPLLRASDPGPGAALALGVLGSATAVPWLLSLLGSGDEPLQVAAGAALARITGAGLVETATVPEPTNEEAARPSARRVERPSTSRATWERWWHTHRARFDERTRYRGGAPFSPRAAAQELAAPLTPFAERRRAAAEIRHHTRTTTPFDPDGWIAEQRAAIRDWQSLQ